MSKKDSVVCALALTVQILSVKSTYLVSHSHSHQSLCWAALTVLPMQVQDIQL